MIEGWKEIGGRFFMCLVAANIAQAFWNHKKKNPWDEFHIQKIFNYKNFYIENKTKQNYKKSNNLINIYIK